MTTRAKIDDFLGKKRLAIVGVSRSRAHWSRVLFREFAARGYDVIPVNPNVKEVEGRACYPRLQDIAPPAEGALITTAATATEAIARDCAEAGIPRLWMYRARGQGAVDAAAVEWCGAHGISVSTGCPLMFFSGAGFPHNLHGWVLKIAGKYPS